MKTRSKSSREDSKLCSLLSVTGLDDSSLPALLPSTPSLSLTGSIQSAAPHGSHSMALESPISWVLQCNAGFTFTVLCNGLFPAAGLSSMVFLKGRGRFHNPFIPMPLMTLKPESWGQHCRVELQMWGVPWHPWDTLVAALICCSL